MTCPAGDPGVDQSGSPRFKLRNSAVPDPRRTIATARDRLEGRSPVVVVVGDVMLDRYLDGTSSRLSPEAPVPVVDVVEQHDHLGGAANVANGLAVLGLSVRLVGIVGADDDAAAMQRMLDARPAIDPRLIRDRRRRTTTKERVRVDGRHVIRIDRDDHQNLDEASMGRVQEEILGHVEDALADADILVVSDYGKGSIGPDLLHRLSPRPTTIVDPKGRDINRYRGAQVITPNVTELLAAAAAGGPPLPIDQAVDIWRSRLHGTAVVVTCGAQGMVWSDPANEAKTPLSSTASLARRVDDVTGAGDSVVCGMAAALAVGLDLSEAIATASVVAAVAVETPGTASPGWDEIADVAAHS